MILTLTYRGYRSRIEYSEEDGCLVGRLIGINDIVGFHGDTDEEIREAFHEAVDGYLEVSERRGLTPQRPAPEGE